MRFPSTISSVSGVKILEYFDNRTYLLCRLFRLILEAFVNDMALNRNFFIKTHYYGYLRLREGKDQFLLTKNKPRFFNFLF